MTSQSDIENQKLLNKQAADVPTTVTGTVIGDTPYGGHPNSAYLPRIRDFTECKQLPADQWHSGMCDCLQDTNSCCETIWCSHCTLGYQHHKLKTGVMGPDWWMCFGVFCADVLLKGGAFAFVTWDLRNQLRMRWNIEPEANEIGECVKSFCCPSLAQCQIQRELTYRGYWPGSLLCKEPNAALLPAQYQMQ